MPERQYSLCVCRFPGNQQEHPASSGWVIEQMRKWLSDKRISRVFHLRASDTPIDMVRNKLVTKALAEGADYILMIDSDMQPDCEPDGKPFWDTSWEFMMERRAREAAHLANLSHNSLKSAPPEEFEKEAFSAYPPATIAAPYCGPPPDECVYVLRWISEGTGDPIHPRPFRLGVFDRDHASAFSGIFEVAALPTGLILYDARVFKKLAPPWYAYEWGDPPHNTFKASTEDVFQTRNASLLGMPQYCNWDAWAAHIKLKYVRKPRALDAGAVPDAMADAIRKGTRGDHKVVIVGGPESSRCARPDMIAD